MSKSTHFNNPKYFEAIIQLRPFDQDVFDYLQKEIAEKNNSHYFISRVEELKTGIDIYFSSQRYARTLGQRLKRKFPHGQLLVTEKFHTVDKMTSKLLSRATVLFRFPKKRRDDEE